jgi:type I restriction enzyme, S subunit
MIDGLKPYTAYKYVGVPWLGDVPAHWDVTRAGNLLREVDVRSKTGAETHLSMSQRLGLVPSREIEERRLVSESYVGAKLCATGDLVLNRLKAHLGVFARAFQPGLVSPDYTVLRRVSDGIAIAFLEYVLRSSPCRTELRTRAKGLVEGFWRLYTDDFYQIKLPAPPISEQNTIVRFLDHADRQVRRYILAKKKLIALLNEQKQGTIHKAVTCGLNQRVPLKPSGVRWLGNVPQHWEVWQVGHFGRVGNGSTPSRGNSAYWSGGSYPWLNSSSVHRSPISGSDQFVTDLALRECHLPRVPPSSVLVAITGQGKTRGTAAVLATEATINQHIAYITPRRDVVSAEYLHLVFSGAYRELRSISDDSGSTKGALTCADIGHFKVALPGLEEQEKIIRAIRLATQRLEAALVRSQHEIELLSEYRARLIADVVTGKIDVREAGADLPDVPTTSGDEGLLDEAAAESDAANLDDAEAEVIA